MLPIGSFEPHGPPLPLSTDSLIATAIAERIAEDYDLLALPVMPLGCSHEHASYAGTVSITATTLYTVVTDVAASLAQSGIKYLVLVNAHGGNYVLSNVVQESNTRGRRMTLFPQSDDWKDTRIAAGVETNNHDDMHAGEAETSILLFRHPEVVRVEYQDADHLAGERRHLLVEGMQGYTPNGVIGRPSPATADKGRLWLDAFSRLFKDHLAVLREVGQNAAGNL